MVLNELCSYAPVIVGAMGGSGTRLISRFLRDLNFYMGKDLNDSNDTMNFVDFYDKWINRHYNRSRQAIDGERMREDFKAAFSHTCFIVPLAISVGRIPGVFMS